MTGCKQKVACESVQLLIGKDRNDGGKLHVRRGWEYKGVLHEVINEVIKLKEYVITGKVLLWGGRHSFKYHAVVFGGRYGYESEVGGRGGRGGGVVAMMTPYYQLQ